MHKADFYRLITSYDEDLDKYERIYASKVFTDTYFPCELLNNPKVEYGGTGFYFDKAPNLPSEIEHHYPDYEIYVDWINEQIANGSKRDEYKMYLDYSLGFMTRGCFRKCEFCVNQKYDRVFKHSPLSEFYNPDKKKICLLDDNILGCKDWREILEELKATKKPFRFMQGMDERILTDEKCELLFSCKYDGYYTFAFDDVDDYDLIERKLKLIRKYCNETKFRFYVLCGFKSTDDKDIEDTFKRIELLFKYGCVPYIMRYQSSEDKPYEHSINRGMYVTLARWCNQPSFVKNKTFREFSYMVDSSQRYMEEFGKRCPHIAEKYYDMRFKKWNENTSIRPIGK